MIARRSPAYAREVSGRRQSGERIGLLVVAIHDWKAGKWFENRPEVARVVIAQDQPLNAIRFECAHALDVLLCGSGSTKDIDQVATALAKAEPASVWAEYQDGIWRLEYASREWLAVEGPYPIQWLGRAIQTHRTWCLMRGEGIYGRPVFAEARLEAYRAVFGAEAQSVMRDVFQARAAGLLVEAAA